MSSFNCLIAENENSSFNILSSLCIVFKIVCICIVNDIGVPLNMSGSNNTSGSVNNSDNSSVCKCYSGIEYVFKWSQH